MLANSALLTCTVTAQSGKNDGRPGTGEACKVGVEPNAAMDIAHVVLGSPYGVGTKDGLVPSSHVLRVHLWSVALLSSNLAAVLVVLSTDKQKKEIPGYMQIDEETKNMTCPVHIIRVANNSMGSYGMYLHAFAIHRRQFDYYTFSEVDYVPVHTDFAGILARLYDATFVGQPGMLVGVLQGHPVERSAMPPHPQGAHIMSTASLERLFHHVYAHGGWNKSMSDRMVILVKRRNRSVLRASNGVYDAIQVGVGLLMAEAGIAIRDFTSAFRSPYWNHMRLLDWTGVSAEGRLPLNRTLFVPVQALFLHRMRRCCGLTWEMCRKGSKSCQVSDWRVGEDCCTDAKISEADGWLWLRNRKNHTIAQSVIDAASITMMHSASVTHPPPWLHITPPAPHLTSTKSKKKTKRRRSPKTLDTHNVPSRKADGIGRGVAPQAKIR